MPRAYEETGLVRAHARSVRSSSQKARTVLTHIRGKSVAEAQAILRYSTRGVARDIELVLRSAVANAVQNHGLEAEQLVVHAATADEGLTMKRGKPRARGRYMRVRRRTCHLTILLMPVELAEVEEAPAAPAEEETPKPRRSRAKKAAAEAPAEAPAEEAAAEAEEPEAEPEASAAVEEAPAEEAGGDRAGGDGGRARARGDRGGCERRARRRRGRESLMGQKVHPGGLRVGIIHEWKSNWYTENKEFSKYLLEDIRIRQHIYGRLSHAGLSDIHIRKDSQKITIDIYTARPGIVIGKSGTEVDALRRWVYALTGRAVQININEIKRPELDAKLMAQSVAEQLRTGSRSGGR